MEMYIAIFIAVVVVSAIISGYNSIIGKHKSVIQSWDDVTVIERQKLKILPELQRILDSHKVHESGLLSKIADIRSSLSKMDGADINPKQCEELSKASNELVRNLHVVSENYPELRSSESFSKMMHEIVSQEEQVGAALRVFNQNVSIFNTTIESFPTNMVNGALAKKKAVDSFKDSTVDESFSYTPNF